MVSERRSLEKVYLVSEFAEMGISEPPTGVNSHVISAGVTRGRSFVTENRRVMLLATMPIRGLWGIAVTTGVAAGRYM